MPARRILEKLRLAVQFREKFLRKLSLAARFQEKFLTKLRLSDQLPKKFPKNPGLGAQSWSVRA